MASVLSKGEIRLAKKGRVRLCEMVLPRLDLQPRDRPLCGKPAIRTRRGEYFCRDHSELLEQLGYKTKRLILPNKQPTITKRRLAKIEAAENKFALPSNYIEPSPP